MSKKVRAKPELRKLNRAELLELLVAQTERADRMERELAEAREALKQREQLIMNLSDFSEFVRENQTSVRASIAEPHEIKPAEKTGGLVDMAVEAKKKVGRAQYAKKETNGIDLSAIGRITSGIGKGKI